MTFEVLTRFIKYSAVGIFCTCVYFLCMFLFVELAGLQPITASVLSFLAMTGFSFFLNVKFTFGGLMTRQKLFRFTLVSFVGFTLNFVIMFMFIEVFSFHYLIGELVTTLVIPIVNFVLNNFWALKPELDAT